MLLVTQAAGSRKLLTEEEMRLAAGISVDDDRQDAALAVLNDRISAEIVRACRIAVANGGEPTLRQETLLERFQLEPGCTGPLILARRHDVEIISVTVDGAALTPADWEVHSEAGLLARMRGEQDSIWTGRVVKVSYRAGFAVVPAELTGAASDMVRLRRSEASRDPLAKRERVDVDGVEAIETEYWVNMAGTAAEAGTLPAEILARLGRFNNRVRS